jgi:hypothetical protein
LQLEDVAKQVTDERLRAKVLGVHASPVARAIGTIAECAQSGDHLALDWLEEAIRYWRTRSNSPAMTDEQAPETPEAQDARPLAFAHIRMAHPSVPHLTTLARLLS